MESKLQISINGQRINQPYFGNYPPGSALEGFTSSLDASSRGIYLVETPLDQYQPDYEAILVNDGAEIDLGELHTVTQRGVERFSITMVDGVLYDCFNLHSGLHLDSARIVSGTQEPPGRLTLEEVALLIVIKSQLSLDQVNGVKAQVIGGRVHLYNRQQLLHYGLVVGEMVATVSRQSPFVLIHTFKDPSRFFDQVTEEMFANNLRGLAGYPPLSTGN